MSTHISVPAVSVVVPCFNAAETLDRCMAALTRQDVPPQEIIVVDNGSQDGSPEIVEQWRKKVRIPVFLERAAARGAAAARNAGAARAAGEWLAFTDADCEPGADWIKCGIEHICTHDVQALAGPARGTMEGGLVAKLMGLTSLSVGLDEHVVRHPAPTGLNGFASANLWIDHQVFNHLGGFDESLSVAGEDMDLCLRLYTSGGALLYVPALDVRHIHPAGMAPMFRKMIHYGKAHALLMQRHGLPGVHTDIFSAYLPLKRTFIHIEFRSADKKVLLLLLLSWFWAPAFWLLPCYLMYLILWLKKRGAQYGYKAGIYEAAGLALVLLAKSAGMTLGRWLGSGRRAWAL